MLQVKYEHHPNQALIEFAHPSSARAAIRDTEAVLNNRFIRVYWHNAKEEQQAGAADGNVRFVFVYFQTL